ncbi:MAG: MFS transporter [Thermoplasmatota archaeon]
MGLTAPPNADRRKWLAFVVLCLGTLMEVLDTTIVNVALPSVQQDLGFSQAGLAWVINAFMLTFGGFLLLGGRMGDLFGARRLFLGGIVVFTLASLACGVAQTPTVLIVARAVQGVGAAIVSAVALALIMSLFREERERTKAMAYFGFIAAGGGAVGVLLGGLMVNSLDWHWVFLVNVPIGIAVFVAGLRLLPRGDLAGTRPRLDVAGAFLVTAALVLAVYAVVGTTEFGWTSPRSLILLGGATVLLASFLLLESKVRDPLMPLALFKMRNVATANVVGVLWAAAMFAWFFLSALYMQRVLGYSPLQVGLGFLPANVIMASFSFGLSERMVRRFGLRWPLAIGLALAGTGLALFARAPVDGGYALDVLPGMVLLGLGAGMAFNPVLLSAMNDVKPSDAGLASGLVNTSFMMGGALGLAILASLAASRSEGLLASGMAEAAALNGGYHAAFVVGAGFAFVAATLGALLLRPTTAPADAPKAAVPQ